MVKISFHTFGCKNNLADTNKLLLHFHNIEDITLVDAELEANIHVVNTCTVTSSADAQARNLLRRLARHNKDALIIVTGCSVRRDKNEYKKLVQEIERSGNELQVCNLVPEDINGVIKRKFKLEVADKNVLPKQIRTRAFLQIQDGCNHFCSYCIVPFVRGEPKSVPISKIVSDAKALESYDIKEAVLTGINIGDHELGIESVIQEILNNTKKIRIRLSSLRPSSIRPALIDIMKEKRVCPHLHISLQHGSDSVLRLMNRKDYLAEDFILICEEVDKRIGARNPFMAADVIVGHPGEDTKAFKECLTILKKSNLNKLHVFPYSPRPGTASYSMKRSGQNDTQRRRDILLGFSEKRYLASLRKMKGSLVDVLWETNDYGHSENYYPVKGKGAHNHITALKVMGIDVKGQMLLV